MSPFTTFSGDPEKNIDAFNHAMDTGSAPSSTPCCEASDGLTVADALEELKALKESSLSRLYDYLQSSSVAFITAFKSTPWIKQHYAEQLTGVDNKAIPRAVGKINRARNEKLLQNIKAFGYSCIKVDGSYENQEREDLYGGDESKRKFFTDKEESFAVICKNNAIIDEFLNRMLKLCNDYNQESFLIVYAGNKKSQFIYADGSRDDAGGYAFGSDAPFKTLVNGRPVVVENISDLIEPNIKSSVQLKRYSEPFSVYEALEELKSIDDGEIFLSANALRVLDEANLRRISQGHEKDGYAILSASREHRSEEENNKKTNELRQKLKDAHYSYIMIYGGYKENGQSKASLEKSFVVFPYDISNNTLMDFNKFKEDMVRFCTDYDDDNENQDSILICEPGGKPHYVPLKKDIDVYGDDINSVEYNDMGNEFFTALKKWSDSSLNRKNHSWDKGTHQRYTVKNECFIDNPPTSMQVAHSRWAVGDLNHIYKESSSVVKAKRLFKEPYKMDYIKTFAIFTAYNPDAVRYSKKDNIEFQKHHKGDLSFSTDKYIEDNSTYFSVDDMDNSIKNGHWHYYKVKGVYGNVERSLLVYNISLEDAKELSKKYRQQSFIFGINENGVLKFEFYANASKSGYSYHKVDERDDFTVLDDDADNYYTQIARDFRINIPFEVFEVAADQMIEAINNKNYILKWSDDAIMKCIEESVDDSITGKQRYFARSTLWSNK